MYGGDRSRKEALVNTDSDFLLDGYRPLKFPEFEMQNQVIFVRRLLLIMNWKNLAEFINRTNYQTDWTSDPIIEVRPTMNQIDLIEEIQKG